MVPVVIDVIVVVLVVVVSSVECLWKMPWLLPPEDVVVDVVT